MIPNVATPLIVLPLSLTLTFEVLCWLTPIPAPVVLAEVLELVSPITLLMT
ncbi:MAG TPA: hypothetical protein VKA24_02645 [Gaiellaceae bacterium]|nr:hypothetical protein [Gaiellaceae bacterium]